MSRLGIALGVAVGEAPERSAKEERREFEADLGERLEPEREDFCVKEAWPVGDRLPPPPPPGRRAVVIRPLEVTTCWSLELLPIVS
mmetsp:Transcript_75380/g.164460  ORF Transcript_75380/g.164460 Transcript_75380/m.164460 type:complete len:86 (-) Transcript_75380:187-444(-)